MDELIREVPLGVRLGDLETRGVITIHDPYSPDDVARMLEDGPEPPRRGADDDLPPIRGEVGTLPGVAIIGSADVVNSGPAKGLGPGQFYTGATYDSSGHATSPGRIVTDDGD